MSAPPAEAEIWLTPAVAAEAELHREWQRPPLRGARRGGAKASGNVRRLERFLRRLVCMAPDTGRVLLSTSAACERLRPRRFCRLAARASSLRGDLDFFDWRCRESQMAASCAAAQPICNWRARREGLAGTSSSRQRHRSAGLGKSGMA
jgi:hypothetical protein